MLKDFDAYNIIWRDTSFERKEIVVKDLRSGTTPLPNDLAQSFVQIQSGDVNLITVTVYFKKERRQGGTCLIQGQECSKWALTEYRQLVEMVETLETQEQLDLDWLTSQFSRPAIAQPHSSDQKREATPLPIRQSPDKSQTEDFGSAPRTPPKHATVSDECMTTPLHPVTSLSDLWPNSGDEQVSPSISPILMFPPSQTNEHYASSTLQSPSSSTPSLQPPTSASIPTGGDATCSAETTALSTSDAMLAPEVLSSPVPTTNLAAALSPPSAHDVTSIDTTSVEPMPDAVTPSVPSLSKAMEITPTDPTPTNNPPTHVVPFVKRSLLANANVEPHQCLATPCCQQQQQLMDARARIATLEEETASLRASLALLSARLDSVDQLARDNVVKISNGFKAADTYLSGQLANVEENWKALANTQKGIKSKVASLDSAKTTLTHVMRELQEKVDTLSASTSVHSSPSTHSSVCDSDMGPYLPPHDSSSDSGATPSTSSRNLSRGGNRRGAKIPVVANQRTDRHDNYQQPRRERHYNKRFNGPSPRQTLLTYSVIDDASAVVIGDSVLMNVSSERMARCPEEIVQVISVSGLKTPDLLVWLQQQPVCSHVQLVTIHIGVNDCKSGEVTSYTWDQILDGCRHVFPLARVQLSSIIQARGRLPINENIEFSNGNLFRVCRRRNVTFVDNSAVFRSRTGAPKKSLYRATPGDYIHPSIRGVMALEANFLIAGQPSDPPEATPTQSVCTTQPLHDASSSQSRDSHAQWAHTTPSYTSANYLRPAAFQSCAADGIPAQSSGPRCATFGVPYAPQWWTYAHHWPSLIPHPAHTSCFPPVQGH